MIFYVLLPLILITISIWIIKHTYRTKRENGKYVACLNSPLPFPVWSLILLVIFLYIPLFNIVIFTTGLFGWLINYLEDNIRLGDTPKWFNSIQNFLTKQV